MLYLIGLGLYDEKDVTVRGLEIIKECDSVYLEAYTSILGIGVERLEAFYKTKIKVADREFVESGCEDILEESKTGNVAFLVVGDPLGATTHSDLMLRAHDIGVEVSVIHNASIMNAVASVGLALYNYGQTVSIPFFTDNWKPASWMGRIRDNRSLGLHTLCLLDIKVKEISDENLARGKKIYEPPRFMSVPRAISQILEVLEPQDQVEGDSEKSKKQVALDPENTLAISVSRLGQPDQKFVAGTLQQLSTLDEQVFGTDGLHSLVILGSRINPVERNIGSRWTIDNGEAWNRVCREVYDCVDE